jgi:hypothetical protein
VSKKRSCRKRRKQDRADKFTVGPIYGYRVGKRAVIGNRATPEEFAALRSSLAEQKLELPQLMRRSSEELLAKIAEYDPLVVLGFIFHLHHLAPQFAGREISESFALVEHLALLLAKDRRSGTVPVLDGEIAGSVRDVLREQLQQAIWSAMPEPSADASPSMDSLDDAQAAILFWELGVRGERYADQQEALIRALFTPFNAELKDLLGFDCDEALRIEGAYDQRIRAVAMEGMESAQSYMIDVDRVLKGKPAEDARTEPMVDALRALGTGVDVRQYAIWTVILWSALRTGYSLAPTAPELVSETGLPRQTIDNALRHLTTIASDLADYWALGAGNRLKQKPLVAINEYYALPSPSLFLAALQTLFESALKSSAAWERYQNHRAKYGEDRAAAVFAHAFPGATVYRNPKYRDAGLQLEGEVDVMVVFERQLFLIEVKSGDFADAARQGVESRVEAVLNDLVTKAHEQAERAARYIDLVPVARFRDGSHVVELRKSDFDAVHLIGITLEQLGHIVNTAGSYLCDGKPHPPWTVSVDDLDIIVEILNRPAEILHYIKKRQTYLRHPSLRNPDELGFLETYLQTSLQDDPTRFKEYTHVMLDPASPTIDAYGNGRAVGAAVVAPMHKIPQEVARLLDKLSETRPNGWLAASISLLDLIPRHQRVIARAVSKFLAGGKVLGVTVKDSNGQTVAKLRLDDPRLAVEAPEAVVLTIDSSSSVLDLSFGTNT